MTGPTAVAAAAVLAAASVGSLLAFPPPGTLRLAELQVSRAPSDRAGPPWWLVAPALFGVLALLGPVVALLGAVGLLVLRRVARGRADAAQRRDERRRAMEACAALAGELRSGRSAAAALSVAADLAAGPSRAALQGAAFAARFGGDVAAALLPSAAAPGARGSEPTTAVPEVLRALAACWTVCSASGSGLAAAVDRLEEGLRADQERRRAVEAELAGPRATAGLLAVLPVAGLLLATGLGADPAAILLETPLGLFCLVAGLGLDGLGLLWTARLVARAGGTDVTAPV